MSVNLSTGLRNGMLNATGMKEALANGVIYVYTGSKPTSADSAVQGTLLGKITVSSGAFSFGTSTNGINLDTPVAGVVSKAVAEVWSFVGIAIGTAGWFRYMGNASDSLGASTTLPRMDGSIATSGADMNLSNINVVVGAPNTIDVFAFTLPES